MAGYRSPENSFGTMLGDLPLLSLVTSLVDEIAVKYLLVVFKKTLSDVPISKQARKNKEVNLSSGNCNDFNETIS